ncbi:BTG3 protein, partial [Amia calva]|nr:BTG3 protein [Amia calva]
RCIRVNRSQWDDPELHRACEESRVLYCDPGCHGRSLWVDPGEVRCRYGEDNDAFKVESFPSSGDADNKEDITKEGTSTVGKVTSHYHSGSSSDEESGTRDAKH